MEASSFIAGTFTRYHFLQVSYRRGGYLQKHCTASVGFLWSGWNGPRLLIFLRICRVSSPRPSLLRSCLCRTQQHVSVMLRGDLDCGQNSFAARMHHIVRDSRRGSSRLIYADDVGPNARGHCCVVSHHAPAFGLQTCACEWDCGLHWCRKTVEFSRACSVLGLLPPPPPRSVLSIYRWDEKGRVLGSRHGVDKNRCQRSSQRSRVEILHALDEENVQHKNIYDTNVCYNIFKTLCVWVHSALLH